MTNEEIHEQVDIAASVLGSFVPPTNNNKGGEIV